MDPESYYDTFVLICGQLTYKAGVCLSLVSKSYYQNSLFLNQPTYLFTHICNAGSMTTTTRTLCFGYIESFLPTNISLSAYNHDAPISEEIRCITPKSISKPAGNIHMIQTDLETIFANVIVGDLSRKSIPGRRDLSTDEISKHIIKHHTFSAAQLKVKPSYPLLRTVCEIKYGEVTRIMQINYSQILRIESCKKILSRDKTGNPTTFQLESFYFDDLSPIAAYILSNDSFSYKYNNYLQHIVRLLQPKS